MQLDIFDEQRLADECQLTGPSGVDLSSHQDIFYAILRQVKHFYRAKLSSYTFNINNL